MHGEPYEDNNLENPQSSVNQIRIEQAKWYLEGCVNVLNASPGPEPGDEVLTKTVRHALDLIQRRLRGDEFMHNEAVCNPQKHRGPDDVRRESIKAAEADSQNCSRRADERRREAF